MHPLKLVKIKNPFGILQPTTQIPRKWVGCIADDMQNPPDIPQIFPRHPPDIPNISPRYPPDILKIYPSYFPDIPQDIPQDMPKISPRNKNIPKTSQRYPKYIAYALHIPQISPRCPHISRRYVQDIRKDIIIPQISLGYFPDIWSGLVSIEGFRTMWNTQT